MSEQVSKKKSMAALGLSALAICAIEQSARAQTAPAPRPSGAPAASATPAPTPFPVVAPNGAVWNCAPTSNGSTAVCTQPTPPPPSHGYVDPRNGAASW